MKILIILLVNFLSSLAHAEFYVAEYYSTSYIYRGMSFYNKDDSDFSAKNGQGLFQTEVGYYKTDVFNITAFYGPTETFNRDKGEFQKDQEIDVTAGVTHRINSGLAVGALVNVYNYFSNTSNNMQDYNLNLTYQIVKLEVSYIRDYAGFGSSDLYTKLGIKAPLNDKFGIMGHVGRSNFSEEDKLGMTSYTDYKLGAYWNPYEFLGTELAYTNTSERKILMLDKTMDDGVVTFTIFGAIGF